MQQKDLNIRSVKVMLETLCLAPLRLVIKCRTREVRNTITFRIYRIGLHTIDYFKSLALCMLAALVSLHVSPTLERTHANLVAVIRKQEGVY